MPIPYGRQTIEDDDIAAVVEVLRGDWLTQGPAVREFEEHFAEACEAPYAVAFSSGTAALHAAAFAAGLGPGDRVVTSALTFAASANCAAYVGAVPVFADIDPETWNVSGSTVATVAEGAAAVIPVHFAGLPAPIEEIRKSVGSGVKIIEDAAHALGARDADGPIGSCVHSDMATFSLHPVKTIAAGEGGVVTTRDRELRDRLRRFRNHGFRSGAELGQPSEGWWYEQHDLGFNYRLTDIQSALASSQLAKLDRFIERRNDIAAHYRRHLTDLYELELPPAAPPLSLHAHHLFVVRHRGGLEARRWLYEELRAREILVQVHYIPVYWQPWYRDTYGYERGMCPAAERYYQGCVSLPCFPSLAGAEQNLVIETIRELVGG